MPVGSECDPRSSISTFSSNSILSINSNVDCNSVFQGKKNLDAPEKYKDKHFIEGQNQPYKKSVNS